ncbi:hypothetical protein [Sphingomonas sp. 28-63-12]|uniref:hypothetical protein n=1 Tax=Sphingomonas sp. 28-63-12 TaxID=1970434 RepID=UPI000BDB31DF|nr:MAG: hypothetical protein B7Y47_00590 [Sphingomonas sp. 28-63-12]
MPSISYDAFVPWTNYHLTIPPMPAGALFPVMRVEDQGRLYAADAAGMTGLKRFVATAVRLHEHVARVAAILADKQAKAAPPLAHPFAAGLVGRGWSFAPLIGAPVSQLMCDGLTGFSMASVSDIHPHCQTPAKRIAFASGGTRLRELVRWAEGFGLTVPTSGTHLGPTLAGGFGTASHGSKIGYGGLQNMVLGMHLVCGASEHVWIERRSHPVLSDSGVKQLDIGSGNPVRVVRDDAMFEDALVHLGGMGIVNGVAVELVDNQPFGLLKRDVAVNADWLAEISCGQFAKVAKRLGFAGAPAFYEITFDPHAPFGKHALHTMYFAATAKTIGSTSHAGLMRPGDAVAAMATTMAAVGAAARPAVSLPDPTAPVLRYLLEGNSSAFDYYRSKGMFEPGLMPFKPGPGGATSYVWGQLHGDDITGGIPGALYNASFAVPRSDLRKAIPLICEAVKDLPGSFVFTVRFVSHPGGSLAFTRFEENAVIEIDGLSPFVCNLQAAQLPPETPQIDDLRKMLALLAQTVPKGAALIRRTLEKAHIPYSMHWAKLGDLDKPKVYADFGNPSESDSMIRRWRKTREALLSPLGRAIFWNEALINYGLLDRPTALPPYPAAGAAPGRG